MELPGDDLFIEPVNVMLQRLQFSSRLIYIRHNQWWTHKGWWCCRVSYSNPGMVIVVHSVVLNPPGWFTQAGEGARLIEVNTHPVGALTGETTVSKLVYYLLLDSIREGLDAISVHWYQQQRRAKHVRPGRNNALVILQDWCMLSFRQLFPSDPYVTVSVHFCLHSHLSSPRAWNPPFHESSVLPVVSYPKVKNRYELKECYYTTLHTYYAYYTDSMLFINEPSHWWENK